MDISDSDIKHLADDIEQLTYRMKTMEHASVNNLSSELSVPEIQVIIFLGYKGPNRMSNIAAHMFASLSNMTVIVDKLVKKALVGRSRSPKDRRVVIIELTEKGKATYIKHRKIKLELSRRMLAALDEPDRKLFLGFIDQIIRDIK